MCMHGCEECAACWRCTQNSCAQCCLGGGASLKPRLDGCRDSWNSWTSMCQRSKSRRRKRNCSSTWVDISPHFNNEQNTTPNLLNEWIDIDKVWHIKNKISEALMCHVPWRIPAHLNEKNHCITELPQHWALVRYLPLELAPLPAAAFLCWFFLLPCMEWQLSLGSIRRVDFLTWLPADPGFPTCMANIN